MSDCKGSMSGCGTAARDPLVCLARGLRCAEEAHGAAQRGDIARTLERARAARDQLDAVVAWLEDPDAPSDLSREIDAERDRLGMRAGFGLSFQTLGRKVTFYMWGRPVTLPQRVGLDLLRAFKPGQRGCTPGDYDELWEIICSKRETR